MDLHNKQAQSNRDNKRSDGKLDIDLQLAREAATLQGLKGRQELAEAEKENKHKREIELERLKMEKRQQDLDGALKMQTNKQDHEFNFKPH